jgi:hypothetical protein
METEKPIIRRRVNKSVSVKGVVTTEATFEATGLTEEQYINDCSQFFLWVDLHWPPPITLGA